MSREKRLTYILKDLKNEFWENFGVQRIESLRAGMLLIRTKHFDSMADSIILSQIWRSKADYEWFLETACGDQNLEAILKEKGISTEKYEELVDKSFGPELLQDVLKYPHIVQYIIDEWKTTGLEVGDPLKKGRLHLPDP